MATRRRVLSREEILAAKDIKTVEVEVPEWGGAVTVKPLTAAERDEFEASVADEEGNVERANFRAKLVARCLVDAEGQRLFTDGDIAALGGKNALPLNRVFDVCATAAGLAPSDVAAMEGNSNGQGGASSSA